METTTTTRYVLRTLDRSGGKPEAHFDAFEDFGQAVEAQRERGGDLVQVDNSASDQDAIARGRYAWGWGGQDATFPTPEGFALPKPLKMPFAMAWGDLFEDGAVPWDHATMSARNGSRPRTAPDPQIVDGNEVGPFCWVKLDQIGRRGQSLAVRARREVLDAVRHRFVSNDDRMSWQVIAHKHSGRALVILKFGQISGGVWVAYIDPATIPHQED